MKPRSPIPSLLLFSSLVLSPALLKADVNLPLSSIPGYALKNNPDLAAARLRILEAQARLHQAGRLSNPEMEFDYSKNPRSSERNVGVAFSQKFPLTSRLRQEKVLSRQLMSRAEAEVRNEERKLVAEANSVAIKLLVADQKKALLESQVKSSSTLVEAVERRTQAGEIAPTDAAQLAIDNQNRLLAAQLIQGQRAVLLGELKPLLGVPVGETLNLKGSLPAVTTSAGKGSSGTNRPDLESARIGENVAQSEIDLARSSKWEDIGVGLTFEHERSEDAPEGIGSDGYVGFKISLPLPLWKNQKGLIAEKEAARTRAMLETKALEARIKGEAAAARAEMAANAKIIQEVNANLLPTIARHTDTIEKAYNKGEADLMDLLRSREQKFGAESSALEALRDYHLARVRYEAATATQPGMSSSLK